MFDAILTFPTISALVGGPARYFKFLIRGIGTVTSVVFAPRLQHSSRRGVGLFIRPSQELSGRLDRAAVGSRSFAQYHPHHPFLESLEKRLYSASLLLLSVVPLPFALLSSLCIGTV